MTRKRYIKKFRYLRWRLSQLAQVLFGYDVRARRRI